MPETQPRKKRNSVKKYPIEKYKHYTIYIISDISPTLFTAEKADPSKGATVSSDSLDGVKTEIDNGELKILQIQPAGKKPMDWKSFVNGLHGAEIKYGE